MRRLRLSRYRAGLTGVALAAGLMTAMAVAGTSATAATSNSSHSTPAAIAATIHSGHMTPALAARDGLVRSPLGWHTANMTARDCSSSTAHWFTLHISFLGGGSAGWQYYCLGGTGTWYFPVNDMAWACAGNNHGTFGWYIYPSGEGSHKYVAGWSSSYLDLDSADYLTINGWSGSDNC